MRRTSTTNNATIILRSPEKTKRVCDANWAWPKRTEQIARPSAKALGHPRKKKNGGATSDTVGGRADQREIVRLTEEKRPTPGVPRDKKTTPPPRNPQSRAICFVASSSVAGTVGQSAMHHMLRAVANPSKPRAPEPCP